MSKNVVNEALVPAVYHYMKALQSNYRNSNANLYDLAYAMLVFLDEDLGGDLSSQFELMNVSENSLDKRLAEYHTKKAESNGWIQG